MPPRPAAPTKPSAACAAPKAALFDQLKFCLTGQRSAVPCAELAGRLGLPGNTLKTLVRRLRQEMQQKDEAAQAKAKQREQAWVAKLAAQAEAHRMAAQERQTELETLRATIEPLKAQLVCAEKERDEAKQSAAEGARQVQDLEEKLIEASSLLSGWNNGKNGGAARNQPTSPLAMIGRAKGRLVPE